MNTNFTIKNFRVFDENGVSLELKPITILTGCNSSGKSSIVKAMLILKHFFMQIKNANDIKAPIKLFDYKIDIATEELKSLGNFANTINRDSDSAEVTFEYTIYSLMLSKDVSVSLSFSVNENDELKNGILQRISMSIDDKEFYSANRKENYYTCNLNAIKKECPDFLELEFLIHAYCSLYGEYNYDSFRRRSNNEYKKLLLDAKKSIQEYDETRSKDILKYVYSSQIQNQDILRRYNIDPNIIDWTREKGSYFNIPVLVELEKAGKEGICSFINDKILIVNGTEEMRFASNKIMNDFISSNASSFFDYFKDYEGRYFKSVKTPMIFEKSGIPRISDFSISQDYISTNPDTYEEVVFNEDTLISVDEKITARKNWRESSVNFPMLYEIVMLWNKFFTNNKNGKDDEPLNKSFSEEKNDTDNGYLYKTLSKDIFERTDYYEYSPEISHAGGYIHYAYRALGAFLVNIIHEVLNPEPWIGIAYASSSRVEASPYYSLTDKSNFSIALKKYFDARRVYSEKRLREKNHFPIGSYINKWIHELGIGDNITFDIFQNLEVVAPKLHKQSGDEGCFLTDVGFGITQLLSVLITVETQILSRLTESSNHKGENRIEGLQDLFKLFDNWGQSGQKMCSILHNTIAIEEPEIHLHPKYQSLLADMFVEAQEKYKIHFIIETHSEYLIRKLQVMVADKDCKLTSNIISLNYIGSSRDGISSNLQIQILEDGDLSESFGKGFYDEADSLAIQLFRNKPILS